MRTFTTSTSHEAVVPNSVVVVPIRPYTTAVGAAARSRATPRVVAAEIPVARSTTSGENSEATRRTSSRPETSGCRRSSIDTSPSANNVCTIAMRKSASLPGRIGNHESASSAVRLRRGSTTTNLPPRARMASSRPGKSGAVHRLPFEA